MSHPLVSVLVLSLDADDIEDLLTRLHRVSPVDYRHAHTSRWPAPRQLTCAQQREVDLGLEPTGFPMRVRTRTRPVATHHEPAEKGPAGGRVRVTAGTGPGELADTRGFTRAIT